MKAKINKEKMPIILSAVSVIGLVGSVALSVRAGMRTERAVIELKSENPEVSKKEIAKEVAPYFIPTAISSITTIGLIISSCYLEEKRYSELMKLYSYCESFALYQDKVTKIVGSDKEKEIRCDTVKDICDKEFEGYEPDVDGKVLFYEPYTETFFKETPEWFINAKYHTNRNFILRGSTTYGEFLDFLEIKHGDDLNEIGWSDICDQFYGYRWIDFNTKKTIKKGKKCYMIYCPFPPHSDYMDPN